MVSIDYDELRRTIDAYPREDLEGHLEFVIHAWHGTGWGYFSNLKPFDLDPLRQIRVLLNILNMWLSGPSLEIWMHIQN
jgi:hypothetical protein